MVVRVVLGVVLATVTVASAQAMSAEEVRKFVSGKVFSFTCSDGTKGDGAFLDDGGAFGDITFPGKPPRTVRLPANTLQVRGASICAAIEGMPVQPCFDLDKTGSRSFRGAVTGMNWMYCDFAHRPDLKLGRREVGQVQAAPVGKAKPPGPPKRLTPPH